MPTKLVKTARYVGAAGQVEEDLCVDGPCLEHAWQALLAIVATTNVLGTKQDLTIVQASSPLMTLSLTCLVQD